MRYLLIIAAFTANSFLAQAQVSNEKKQQLITELNAIAGVFSNQYAPRGWKEKHLNWSLNDVLNKTSLEIMQSQTPREYRQALVNFVGSVQDYHVSVSFVSTERAVLPITVKTVQGKTLFVDIDRSKLPEDSFPFAVGDELVMLDGRSVSDIQRELIQNMGGVNVLSTDLALADLFLTRRAGRLNLPVPNGTALLTVLRAGESVPTNHQLAWEYQPEDAPGAGTWSAIETQTTKLKQRLPMMVSKFAQDSSSEQTISWGIGTKTSFIPALGEKLWSTDEKSIFDAYTYLNENGKIIGVVRIPSYTPKDPAAAVKEMSQILTRMQKQTSALVIDQVNNPGGSVFYLYALVSMLTDQAVVTPLHRMILSEADVAGAAQDLKELMKITSDKQAKEEIGETLSGYPVSYQMVVYMRNFCQFVINQWKQGKRLTDPYYIWGVDQINPSTSVQYTKPIVLLVNELDFSGGDFFPAILQDNKRVTVVGTRTAGAGGYVNSMEFPNSFGFTDLSFTGSLAERINRNPIENLGVTPDIELQLTVEDIRNNLKEYRTQVKNIVNSKVQ